MKQLATFTIILLSLTCNSQTGHDSTLKQIVTDFNHFTYRSFYCIEGLWGDETGEMGRYDFKATFEFIITPSKGIIDTVIFNGDKQLVEFTGGHTAMNEDGTSRKVFLFRPYYPFFEGSNYMSGISVYFKSDGNTIDMVTIGQSLFGKYRSTAFKY